MLNTRTKNFNLLRMTSMLGIAIAALLALCLVPAGSYAGTILSNTHHYDDVNGNANAITIHVDVIDNFLGDPSLYQWVYTVTNNTFDPNPPISNGFSGFELDLPLNVPDLGNIMSPGPGWISNCCSGQPVEWDIRNSAGTGILPGNMGVFSFTSLPRLITSSDGWFHTWQFDGATDISPYSLTLNETGPEVPNVLAPSIPPIPEPSTWLLLGSGIVALAYARRKLAV